jgi:hypothetical protein
MECVLYISAPAAKGEAASVQILTSKKSSIVALYSKYTRAQTFENVYQKQGKKRGGKQTFENLYQEQEMDAGLAVPAIAGAGKAAAAGNEHVEQRPYVHNSGMRGVDSGHAF